MASVPLHWGRIVRQAFVAGLIGGVILEAYLYATVLLPSHTTVAASFQYVASAAIGKEAYNNPSYVWLGLAVHFIVSIGWAGGYAYFAQRNLFVNRRWLVSGLGYGFVVYMFMQILLLGAQAFVFPATPAALINQVIAHLVFYGVPVAFAIARMDRTV
jgi:hypothetical protein